MGNASLTAMMPDTALLRVFVVGHCDIRLEAGDVNCEERFFAYLNSMGQSAIQSRHSKRR